MQLLPMSQPLLYVHICTAIVGLLSGGLAMIFRKGSGRHSAAGIVFVVSMLMMTTSAAFIATFMSPHMINVVAASLAFYLVVTGWVAIKRKDGQTSRLDTVAMLFVLTDGIAAIGFGIWLVNHPEHPTFGIPRPMYFIFGSIAVLFAVSDGRMLKRGGLFGAQRIGRHLWRMCLALLIALMSFYPGQAKLFSKAVRATNLLFIPHVLLIGATIFWLYRISRRKRAQRARVIEVEHKEALAA